ncbi:class B sortase [Christensenellaceae bacterium OttesenSCG-928-K19]|nr:class B sortase [Christensenellaceae bacterium OttesenSCG-928-K19]
MNTTAKKRKKSTVITNIVIIAAVAVLAYSLYNIIYIVGSNTESANIYNNLRNYTATEPAGETTVEGDLNLVIDFDALKAMNEEVIGWIVVPGTVIDYPVTHTTDNSYYLGHSADRTENRAGAIFVDTLNQPDFSDQNTIVYGHNMQSGAMFAGLHDFEDPGFFNEHEEIHLYTPDGLKHTYRIFSAFQTNAIGDTYTITFADETAFNAYVADAKGKSVAPRDVEVAYGDKMITLSTCVRGLSSKRYVLHGVLTSSEPVLKG